MKYLSNKNGFLGIDSKFDNKKKSVVIPFGLEKTVSYGGGTKNGPKEIIKASHQVELYDEELNCEPFKVIGVKTIKPFKINKNINKALKQISLLNQILDKTISKPVLIKILSSFRDKLVFKTIFLDYSESNSILIRLN